MSLVCVLCVEAVVFTLGSAGYCHVPSLPEDAEYAEYPLVVVCAYVMWMLTTSQQLHKVGQT